MFDYEEYKRIKQRTGWIIIFLISFFLISWFMINMVLIGDQPRHWDYSIVEDTPAKSIYSTHYIEDDKKDIQQIEPLPGADSLKTREKESSE